MLIHKPCSTQHSSRLYVSHTNSRSLTNGKPFIKIELMKKILVVFFVLFLLLDLLLALTIFFPLIYKNVLSMFGGPSTCKVLESSYCRQVVVKQSTFGNFLSALVTVRQGTKVYAPIDGVLEYNKRSLDISGSEQLPLHYLRSSRGDVYILLFENTQKIVGQKRVVEGDIIGLASAKSFRAIDGHNFAMTVLNNRKFSEQSFKFLFSQ